MTAFTDAGLRGARFVRCDLSGAVMRGVDVAGRISTRPGSSTAAFPARQRRRRGPAGRGRAQPPLPRPGRPAGRDPEGLRAAWASLERVWAGTLDRVATMPPGAVDVPVAGEWSFSQTLRHLVMATDTWLGGAILRIEQPFHPIGQPHAEYETDGTTCRSSRPECRRTPRCSRSGPIVSPWSAASWPPSPRRTGRAAHEPVVPRSSGDRAVMPAHHPRRGVGAPPLRSPRPRHGLTAGLDGLSAAGRRWAEEFDAVPGRGMSQRDGVDRAGIGQPPAPPARPCPRRSARSPTEW